MQDAMFGNHNLRLVRWSQFSIFGTSSSHLPHYPHITVLLAILLAIRTQVTEASCSEINTPKNERLAPQKGPFQKESSSSNHWFSGDDYVSFSGE